MLDHSKITDKGAKLIGQSLSTNQRLRTLSIVNTPISDIGALAIVNGMKDNTALTDVYLRRTGRNVERVLERETTSKDRKRHHGSAGFDLSSQQRMATVTESVVEFGRQS